VKPETQNLIVKNATAVVAFIFIALGAVVVGFFCKSAFVLFMYGWNLIKF
jgi:hypothetical protein